MTGSSIFGIFGKLKQSLSGDGGEGRTESFPLHLYGKLPIYKDFISSGLTEPAAQEFQKWLSNGFSRRWSAREEYKGTEIPAHSFLLSLPETGRVVAGSLWGSHDEGGLRKFPFILFVALPAGRLPSDPVVALGYLESLEDRAGYIRRNYQSGRMLASFYETYRGARAELTLQSPAQAEKQVAEEVSEITLSDFAESVLGPSAARDWPGFLERLSSLVADAEHGPGAIRLPLGRALPPEVTLRFWLLWLRRQGLVGEGQVRGLLLERSLGRSRAVLFFRDLAPDDILLLHPDRCDYDQVEELAPYAAVPEALSDTEEELPLPAGTATPAAEKPQVPDASPVTEIRTAPEEPRAREGPPVPEASPSTEGSPAPEVSLAPEASPVPDTAPAAEAAPPSGPEKAEEPPPPDGWGKPLSALLSRG